MRERSEKHIGLLIASDSTDGNGACQQTQDHFENDETKRRDSTRHPNFVKTQLIPWIATAPLNATQFRPLATKRANLLRRGPPVLIAINRIKILTQTGCGTRCLILAQGTIAIFIGLIKALALLLAPQLAKLAALIGTESLTGRLRMLKLTQFLRVLFTRFSRPSRCGRKNQQGATDRPIQQLPALSHVIFSTPIRSTGIRVMFLAVNVAARFVQVTVPFASLSAGHHTVGFEFAFFGTNRALFQTQRFSFRVRQRAGFHTFGDA
jgi:hypothetical protein